MNSKILTLDDFGLAKITTPLMTSNSQSGTIGTYTYTDGSAFSSNKVFNTNVGQAINTRTLLLDIGTINYSSPIIVQSINLGSNKTTSYYTVVGITVTLFNGTTQEFQQTYNPYTLAGTSQPVSNIKSTKCHVDVYQVSPWYGDGGYIGTMNGISLTGLII